MDLAATGGSRGTTSGGHPTMDAVRRAVESFWDGVAGLPGYLSQWASTMDEGTFWTLMTAGVIALAYTLGRSLR